MTSQHAFLPAASSRQRGRLTLAILAATLGTALSPPASAADVPSFDLRQGHATLVYTIDIVGHAHQGNDKAGTYHDDTVHQRLDATLHLTGTEGSRTQVDNARQLIERTAPARALMGPAIQQAIATCGEDEACMTAAVMKMSASMRRNHPEVLEGATKAKPKFSQHGIGDWVLDTSKPRCSLHAVTQGTSRYRTIDAGEGYSGYVTGSRQRHGEAREDCARRGMHELPRARARWNGDTRLLKLELPGLAVTERTRDSDGHSGTAKVTIPDVTLDKLHWSGKGPQSGEQTRRVEAGGMPATMTIHWTFTPGKA